MLLADGDSYATPSCSRAFSRSRVDSARSDANGEGRGDLESRDQPLLSGHQGELETVRGSYFVVDPRQMVFDGLLADLELAGDVRIPAAGGDHCQHVALAWRQLERLRPLRR